MYEYTYTYSLYSTCSKNENFSTDLPRFVVVEKNVTILGDETPLQFLIIEINFIVLDRLYSHDRYFSPWRLLRGVTVNSGESIMKM